MNVERYQQWGKLLVLAGLGLILVGVVVGMATWASLFSRYMFVEDLNSMNMWNLDDHQLSAISGATPLDAFSYFVAWASLGIGAVFIVIGLFSRRKKNL